MKKFAGAVLVAATAAATLSACNVPQDTSAQSQFPAVTTAVGHSKASKAPHFTVAQRNAIESAQQYLSMGSGFSRAGLIEQLSSSAGEGFSKHLAVFAVSHIRVNWDQQAVESAKGYLSMSGFSRSGLIEQLSSKAGEGFTRAQATFAVNRVGL